MTSANQLIDHEDQRENNRDGLHEFSQCILKLTEDQQYDLKKNYNRTHIISKLLDGISISSPEKIAAQKVMLELDSIATMQQLGDTRILALQCLDRILPNEEIVEPDSSNIKERFHAIYSSSEIFSPENKDNLSQFGLEQLHAALEKFRNNIQLNVAEERACSFFASNVFGRPDHWIYASELKNVLQKYLPDTTSLI